MPDGVLCDNSMKRTFSLNFGYWDSSALIFFCLEGKKTIKCLYLVTGGEIRR